MTATPRTETIAVIGLGYVGLPLAAAFAQAGFAVIGYDVDAGRIAALQRGEDRNGEVRPCILSGTALRVTADPEALRQASFFVIAVPTPVDLNNCPDLEALRSACAVVGGHMAAGSAVVVESTVYPGVTEDVCVPVLEAASGLVAGRDFDLGYSPERINPGDEDHGIADVVKIVSALDERSLDRVASVYGVIAAAGLHRASSIKVAETAKAIENTQRDLNIALMNEVAKICHLLDIRTSEVLAAAGSKWNFARFHPGLVGGHCIGVDPYYLTAIAQQLGYHPEVILAGRRVNAGMGRYVAQEAIRLLACSEIALSHARVGILGVTFKENVPDLRNSAVRDVLSALRAFGVEAIVHDPVAGQAEAEAMLNGALRPLEAFVDLDALIFAVPHRYYDSLGPADIAAMLKPGGVLLDVRSHLLPADFPPTLRYWSL